ncbi:sulfatase-like hydrolase/transferase [uncultured Clostridium sp.]|uniref:sulfatase-like hydrolase/transferase n=1 Tax=uncultured Clostridium sp. TaxID=59620 RepID=UPI002606AE45|nr:sulfatase-like hydrolase/transferase [uncultured Clostridium sp.]
MQRPNILILMVDEERFPTIYESKATKEWRTQYLKAQTLLKQNGFEFKNHYAASTACAPSRASIYTGQYPSLHGVSQTPGAAKDDFDSDMFWLDPNTVPTFGDYFQQAGYSTFWKGKWHASQADIINPAPNHPSYLSYDINSGIPSPLGEERYLKANKLLPYGFNGWVGPEPFGDLPANSGSSSPKMISGRDVIFANEAIELIEQLNDNDSLEPWIMTTSFVNPHDITLYGEISRLSDDFNFSIDPSVPHIDSAPTSHEDLSTKPRCQKSYKEVYQEAFQPSLDTEEYRQLYYSLMLKADTQMQRVLDALIKSKFYENTIIIFTSDHGDLGGSHGGLFEKWYQAYEETTHVPLIIHNPKLFDHYQCTDAITSHVDLLPTLLSLANIDQATTRLKLKKTHTQALKPVGRDLTPLFNKCCDSPEFSEGIYFMTDDDPTKGQHQETFEGKTYKAVIEPSSVETIIIYLKNTETNYREKWKFSRYFNNSELWTSPNKEDKLLDKRVSDKLCEVDIYTINRIDKIEDFEMYNLTNDPIEANNLINEYYCDKSVKEIADLLYGLLIKQREEKRLSPQ